MVSMEQGQVRVLRDQEIPPDNAEKQVEEDVSVMDENSCFERSGGQRERER